MTIEEIKWISVRTISNMYFMLKVSKYTLYMLSAQDIDTSLKLRTFFEYI